jgi:hypothetical protein
MANDATSTKKLLVGYDPARSHPLSSNFLVPMRENTGVFFVGLKDRNFYDQGQMVYIGKAIAVDDMFTKLVAFGHTFDGANEVLERLQEYFRYLQDYRIGNILRIEPAVDNKGGFRLVKVADHEPFERKNLP